MKTITNFLTLGLLLAALAFTPAAAEDGVVLLFKNSLEQEIVAIRVQYATPGGAPRHSSGQVFLPVGDEYRTGVQGAALPERVIVDCATKSYDFADLSGLEPEAAMALEVAFADGQPLLRRLDNNGDGDNAAVAGVAREYLSDANRPHAIKRSSLTRCKTWEEVRENAETLFEENDAWGRTLYLPVVWLGYFGSARVQSMDRDVPQQGIGFDLRFRLPADNVAGTEDMIASLQDDLRNDGLRPRHFAMQTRKENTGDDDVTELLFSESDGDSKEEQAALQQNLFAAYAGGILRRAAATWVNEDDPAQPGVLLIFSRGTLEAVFAPDGTIFAE